MLSLAKLSLLLPIATAAVIQDVQKPLSPSQIYISNVTLANISMPSFRKFAIEDMSTTTFHLHHKATKLLLGDHSYLVLRRAELEDRESAIWDWLWENDLECGNWADDDDEMDEPEHDKQPRIWLSDNRVFNVDPQAVPRHVISALQDLATQEWKTRSQMSRESYCSGLQDTSKHGEKSSNGNLAASEPTWKAVVPDEYLVYQIPSSVLEQEMEREQEVWKASAEKKKQDILAGRLSVRDLKMPDLAKCVKLESYVWDEGY
ncbi:hypothetical protein E4T39_02250 [Aureobasidium subglaciale]|nr:hypothetical protein E4T39_02250 [Aureobasidium subglaciale]